MEAKKNCDVSRGKLRKAFCNGLKSLQARLHQPEGNFSAEMTNMKSINAFLQIENLLDFHSSSFRFPKVLWRVLLFAEGVFKLRDRFEQ